MSNHESQSQMASETPFNHRIPAQLRFNDIDILGHLNNSVYFTLFDLAKSRYFEAVIGNVFDWNSIDIVVANVNCDFIAPVFFHDAVDVETKVEHIGDKSLMLVQRLIDSNTNAVKCVCRTIMVGFDLEKGITIAITQRWRDALNKFEGRKLD